MLQTRDLLETRWNFTRLQDFSCGYLISLNFFGQAQSGPDEYNSIDRKDIASRGEAVLDETCV